MKRSSESIFCRTIFENYFSQYTEKEQVYRFVSPKVKRLIDILKCYKPSKRPEEEPNPETASTPQGDEKSKDEKCENAEAGGAENEVQTPLTISDSYIRYKNDKANRWKNKKKFQNKQVHQRIRSQVEDSETVCGLIFVKSRLVASIIHYLLSVCSRIAEEICCKTL